MKRIHLFLLILLAIIFYLNTAIENFIEEGMVIFRRLNGSLIKKFKVGTSINLSEQDITSLFKNDKVIRIYVPLNYTTRIAYKLKNGGYSGAISLSPGVHDIKKNINEEVIDLIDVKYNYISLPSRRVLVVDSFGRTLFESDNDTSIDWDLIYSDYGLDNYYVVYPWGRKLYNYRNYPYYKRYHGRPRRFYRRRR